MNLALAISSTADRTPGADAGWWEAQAGDTITVNPAELHDGIGRQGQPRHWHMLFLSPAAIAKFSDIPVASACFTRPVNQSKSALILARNAIQAFTQDDPDRNQAEQLLMLALAAQLEPEQSSEITEVAHYSVDVQMVLDMICQSWDSPLSLEGFASTTKTSKYQILRRFSRELGITPHAYLTQHRVNRARDMIRTGSSLADTAIACGFSDSKPPDPNLLSPTWPHSRQFPAQARAFRIRFRKSVSRTSQDLCIMRILQYCSILMPPCLLCCSN